MPNRRQAIIWTNADPIHCRIYAALGGDEIINALWVQVNQNVRSVLLYTRLVFTLIHEDVIKWKHFPRYWPFVWGTHRSPVNSPHKGQWRRALMFSLIYVWINGWVNNREAGDLRRYRAHYDVTVMFIPFSNILCILRASVVSIQQTSVLYWIILVFHTQTSIHK